MTVERVLAARIRCGHVDDHGRCPSVLHVDADLDDDQVRAAARERGWEADVRTRCPRHRSDRDQWLVKAGPDTVVGTFYDQASAEAWRDRVRERDHPDAYVEPPPGHGGDDG